MLEVRIKHRTYRITNATLDQLVGAEFWRAMSNLQLEEMVKAQHAGGRLVTDGQRLRRASPSEETAHRLRTSESPDEILRNGLLHIAAQINELASDIRWLREQFELDAEAANEPLARARREAPSLPAEDVGLAWGDRG